MNEAQFYKEAFTAEVERTAHLEAEVKKLIEVSVQWELRYKYLEETKDSKIESLKQQGHRAIAGWKQKVEELEEQLNNPEYLKWKEEQERRTQEERARQEQHKAWAEGEQRRQEQRRKEREQWEKAQEEVKRKARERAEELRRKEQERKDRERYEEEQENIRRRARERAQRGEQKKETRTLEEIAKAYGIDLTNMTKSEFRKLAQVCHPDKGGSNELMQKLNWYRGK